jgi:hypothetical protein
MAQVRTQGLLVGFTWGCVAQFATGLVMIGSWCFMFL